MIVNDWVLSTEAQGTIGETRQKLDDSVPLVSIVRGLRKLLSQPQVSQIIEMAQLQIAARKKFPLADQMLFTRKALEQATSHVVASFKSGLVPTGMAVADACCGIGGDLIALSESHQSTGFDSDPLIAKIASHNLLVNNRGNAEVHCCTFAEFEFEPNTFVHLDPDRRPDGRRKTRLELIEPAWDEIQHCLKSRVGAVKLAPASQLEPEHEASVHRQWIGFDRECREQVVRFNHAGFEPGKKSAWVIDHDGHSDFVEGDSESLPEIGDEPVIGEFLYEPHSAVFAAGLTGPLAETLDARCFSLDSPFLLGEAYVRSRLSQAFRVLETGPLDRRKLVSVLRQQDVGLIEWKQRGLSKEDFSRFSSLRGDGQRNATVVLYRVDHRLSFVLCDRIETV